MCLQRFLKQPRAAALQACDNTSAAYKWKQHHTQIPLEGLITAIQTSKIVVSQDLKHSIIWKCAAFQKTP